MLTGMRNLDSLLHTADSALHTADRALHTAEQLVENGPAIFGTAMKWALQNGGQLGFPGLGPLGPHLPSLPGTHCCPSQTDSNQQGSLTVSGNTVNTGRYTISASNSDDGSLTVRDNTTGESVKAWGDPHITTDRGDQTDFQHQPVTFLLDDGTKITIDPTQNSGVNYINNVTITKGNDAVEMGGFRGNLQTQFIPGEGSYLDNVTPDGTVLRPANGNIDELVLPDGTLISGNNVANIDSYANQSQLGSNGQTLIDEGHQLVQEGMQLIQQGNVQQGMQLIQDGAALEMQGAKGTGQGGSSGQALANAQPVLSSSSNANAQPAVSSSNNANAQPVSSSGKVEAKQIYQYLISKYGFTPAQAAGILGNMQVESSFNTGAYNAGEGAIGLCQWEGGRRTALEHFAASQGKPASDWQVQVDFMMSELHGSEKGAYNAIMSATTAGDAAAAFDKYYERSAGTSRSQRIADANNLAAQLA